ncbi:MAG TPA: hypothetical protein VE127_08790 [Solirubrobacteraceae bacterium]|nr:hypothetical protein [Solirubrobacteraceae bacterium]
MRAALATTVLAAAIAVGATVPAGAAKPPSRRQIARAVRSAERSHSLWATINICNSRRHRYRIGVRGQMPSLGFPSVMAMTVTLNSWSAADKRFVAIKSPNAVDRIALGTHRTGLEQDGTIFPFHKGESGRWNATIEFTWKVRGKVVGQAKRRTTAGHRNADFASPPHYSAAQCRIR